MCIRDRSEGSDPLREVTHARPPSFDNPMPPPVTVTARRSSSAGSISMPITMGCDPNGRTMAFHVPPPSLETKRPVSCVPAYTVLPSLLASTAAMQSPKSLRPVRLHERPPSLEMKRPASPVPANKVSGEPAGEARHDSDRLPRPRLAFFHVWPPSSERKKPAPYTALPTTLPFALGSTSIPAT